MTCQRDLREYERNGDIITFDGMACEILGWY